jgi:NAD(P)-dependent dehydrogenase (short-subunit alcohol dehydrogenase family)
MYLDRFNLGGRVAVVTGGGGGVGSACVEALSEAGAHVYIADRDVKRAAAAQTEMKLKGYATDVIDVDVTDARTIDAAARRVVSERGRVDILVCNAGLSADDEAAEDLADDRWSAVIDVNLNGVFRCCRAFGRPMLAAGRGSIVNVGSVSGIIANRPQTRAGYNASKAGVHHLTRSLAAEWGARGVRVNAVAPNRVDATLAARARAERSTLETLVEGTPMARIGEPDEIAAVVLFLASDAASLMTGAIVLADGGYTCW